MGTTFEIRIQEIMVNKVGTPSYFPLVLIGGKQFSTFSHLVSLLQKNLYHKDVGKV